MQQRLFIPLMTNFDSSEEVVNLSSGAKLTVRSLPLSGTISEVSITGDIIR